MICLETRLILPSYLSLLEFLLPYGSKGPCQYPRSPIPYGACLTPSPNS